MENKKTIAERYKNEQRRQWDGVAGGWKKWWALLEQSSAHISRELINMAAVESGHKTLDIATGIGEPSLTLAQKVGPDGTVIAVDQSSEMLAIARERAKEKNINNTEFILMDAESLNFPAENFDSILCRWGLMFLPDLPLALANIKNILVEEGKFATAVWDAPVEQNAFSVGFTVAQKIFNLPPPSSEVPTLFGLANGQIEKKMQEAGFIDIRSKKVPVTYEFPSKELYLQYISEIAAPIIAILEKQPQERHKEYWQALSDSLDPFFLPDGTLRSSSMAICVVGQKPKG